MDDVSGFGLDVQSNTVLIPAERVHLGDHVVGTVNQRIAADAEEPDDQAPELVEDIVRRVGHVQAGEEAPELRGGDRRLAGGAVVAEPGEYLAQRRVVRQPVIAPFGISAFQVEPIGRKRHAPGERFERVDAQIGLCERRVDVVDGMNIEVFEMFFPAYPGEQPGIGFRE